MEDFQIQHRKQSDESWLLSYADLITNLLIFFVALLSAMEVNRVKLQHVQEVLAGKVEAKSLKELEKDLKAYIAEKGYEEVITANRTDRGVLVAINSGIVFPVGSSSIAPKFKTILMDVMQKVLPYADKYEFAVEGHTDSRPIKNGGKYRSNWELGSARALNVRSHLETVGIPRDKLHVEAYADTRPLLEETSDNQQTIKKPQPMDRQRRVMIRIY